MTLKLKETKAKEVCQATPRCWHKLKMWSVLGIFAVLQFCFVHSLSAQSKNTSSTKAGEAVSNSQTQPVKVSGVVSDNSGNTLPGVSVVVEGTTLGTLTDINGRYSIVIPAGKNKLKFSYIGYNTEVREYKNKQVINVTLAENVKSLNEVTVVGYGSQRKSDITGALGNVKVDPNQAAQIHSVDQLMQGKTAGVSVTTGSGAPGAALNVQIRGLGTLSGNTQPLYVVDGVIINTASQDVNSANSNGNYYQETQGGLTGIDPEDIENIEVLKDASATAIYGSRGANGVVLITTKRAQKGKTQITFSSNTDFSRLSKKIPVLSGKDFALYMNELSTTLGKSPIFPQTPSGLDSLKTIDWQDYSTRTAISQNYRVTMSAGSDKTNYYFALGYKDQEGIIKNSFMKAGDIRLNLTQNISPKLSITTNTSMTYSSNNWLQGTVKNGTENSSFVRSMLRASPVLGDTVTLQTLDETNNNDTPQTYFSEFQDYNNEFRIISSANLNYKISNVFTYRLELNGDYRNKTRQQFWGPDLYFGSTTNGLATYSSLIYYSYNINSLLNFNKSFGKHSVSGTVGVTYDYDFTQNSSTSSSNFFSDILMAEGITLGQTYNPFLLNKTMTSTASALARINYNYSDRYLLTLTGREDGASRFAPGRKYGFFPSLAGGWRIDQEPWMKQFDALSNLKLRFGWGQTGVQSIGAYQTQALYTMNQYANASDGLDMGQSISRIANNLLTWETSEQLNLGLDLGLWNSRLTASVDVYRKLSYNLLQNLQIAPSTGFTVIAMNLGQLENKGIELNLNAVVLDKVFKWEIGGNIALNRNLIKSLGLPVNLWGTENMSAYTGGLVSTGVQLHAAGNIFAEGHPAGMFWGLKTDGIYQSTDTAKLMYAGALMKPGDIKYVDRNGDGVIDAKDYTFIGNPNPGFTYGIHTSLSYKSVKLDVQFTGVSGNDILNANLSMEEYSNNSVATPLNIRTAAWVDAWRPDKPSNLYPRLGYGLPIDISDRFIEDGSYLRLSNVTLSYQVPVRKLGFLSSLNVYVSGNNLLLFTKYKGFDPDVNSYTFSGQIIGVDYNSYPHSSSVSFGLNVGF